MVLTKIQKKHLGYVIRKSIECGLDTRDEIYYLLMGYRCFQEASEELIEFCINEVYNFIYVYCEEDNEWR